MTEPLTPPEDATPEDATPEDATPEDATPEDATPEDATPEDATPEDATPEDAGAPEGQDGAPADPLPPSPASPPARRGRAGVYAGVALALAGCAVVAGLASSGPQTSPAPAASTSASGLALPTLGQAPAPSTPAALPKGVSQGDRGYLFGTDAAKPLITVIEDLNCPHCKDFEAWAMPVIAQAVNGGTANAEFLVAAFLSPSSLDAANALACATDQDRFLDAHTLAFDTQGAFAETDLIGWADKIEVPDKAAFTACVQAGTYNDYVTASTEAMKRSGAPGTPAVFLDGQQVDLGSLAYEDFLTMLGVPLPSAAPSGTGGQPSPASTTAP